MGKRRRWGPTVLAPLLALGGCVAVDSFSSRALTYNQQAEDLKESQLMLNVMRAAYREPLQFTDFTQVTGQASASGTAAFALPFSPSPSSFPHADVASPSATISGNQAFSIANLDTQEFYQGILSPIPITSIDYYIEQGFPKTLLLTLVIGRIAIDVGTNAPRTFYNDYYHDDFARFEAVVRALVALGLNSELVKELTNIGPPLAADQIASLRALAPVAEGAALKRFTPDSDPDITPSERAELARRGVTEYFRLQQITQASRFCIDRDLQNLPAASATLTDLGVLPAGDTILGAPTTPADVALEAAAQRCGAPPYLRMKAAERRGYAQPANRFAVEVRNPAGEVETVTFSVDFTVRSVEGIIYYLGELARGELDIGVGQTLSPPQIETGIGTDLLFLVRQNCTGIASEIGAVYAGTHYCVSIDPSGADRSSEVMEIVLQLLALNTSAKTLPAPSVISILAP